MSFLTGLFALLFYVAALSLVSGLIYKLFQYLRTPVRLKIPTTPAPTTHSSLLLRMTREFVFFESGFWGNKGTWIFGWLLHIGLLLVFIRHLRYFLDPVPAFVQDMQSFGVYGGFAMLFGLAGRWARRLWVDRIRYCSTPSDHMLLGLLLMIVTSGLLMTFHIHTDIVSVKTFFIGLYSFDPAPLPTDPILLLHLTLAAVLMIVFPYSKLIHGLGFFFSPTRNQVDNARERSSLVTRVPWSKHHSR